MKKYFLVAIICVMGTSYTLAASDITASEFGTTEDVVCSHDKETLPSLECNGPAQLAETTIQGPASIMGSLTADNSTLNSTYVKGVANLTNSQANSNVQIAGIMNSKNGYFSGNVLITSNLATFNNSKVNGSITMRSDQNPVLELNCKTEVLGNITFQGSPGMIYKSKDSEIKGKVMNGSVQEVTDNKC